MRNCLPPVHALHGTRGVPGDLVGTTHVRVRSAVREYDRVPIAELAARTLRLAQDHRSARGSGTVT